MICEKCQAEINSISESKPYSNHMSTYVDAKTGKVDGVYNGNDETIDVKGVVLVRQDLWKAPATPATTTVKK